MVIISYITSQLFTQQGLVLQHTHVGKSIQVTDATMAGVCLLLNLVQFKMTKFSNWKILKNSVSTYILVYMLLQTIYHDYCLEFF